MTSRFARTLSAAALALFAGRAGSSAQASRAVPVEGRSVRFAGSANVRDLPAASPDQNPTLPAEWIRDNDRLPRAEGPFPEGDRPDPTLRQALAAPLPPAMPGPTGSFAGISADEAAAVGGRFAPPDTVGDVGPNHYVQAVNTVLRVYDKSGAPLTPLVSLGTFFGPLGTELQRSVRRSDRPLRPAGRPLAHQPVRPSPRISAALPSVRRDLADVRPDRQLLSVRLPDAEQGQRLSAFRRLARRLLHVGQPVHDRRRFVRGSRAAGVRPLEDARRRPDGGLHLLRLFPDRPERRRPAAERPRRADAAAARDAEHFFRVPLRRLRRPERRAAPLPVSRRLREPRQLDADRPAGPGRRAVRRALSERPQRHRGAASRDR